MLSANLLHNPVVTKELRTRMRGWRAFILMGGYVLFLGVVMLIAYAGISAESNYRSGGSLVNERMGLQLFGVITWTQSILLLLVIPALASRSLTGELEHKTIELLVLTRLGAGRIVVGKMLSAFLYSMVLLLCSLPIAGICIMFGGISPLEVATIYLLLVGWAFLLVSVAVFWSAIFNRTMVATLFSYGTSAGYMMFTSTVIGVASSIRSSGLIPSFCSLSPGWAPYMVGERAVVCGLNVSPPAVALGFHAALGALLLIVASTHVRYKRIDRSPSIRILLIGISAAAYWLIVGDKSLIWSSVTSAADLREIFAVLLFTVIMVLGLAVPIFATGPIRRKGSSPLRYGLSPRKAFKGDLEGSIAFMVLWAAVLSAVAMGTLAWASTAYHLPVQSVMVHAAKHGALPYTPIWGNTWRMWLRLTFVVIAVLAAFSAIGVLASAVAKKKSEAVAVTIFGYVCSFGLYWAISASYVPGVSNPHSPIWQLAALWPPTPVTVATGGWGSSMPPLTWVQSYSWLVVGLAYIAMTVLAMWGTSAILKKRPGIQEE